MAQINVGVLGLGFMGTTHFRAYQSAAAAGYPVKVVAVCDSREKRRMGLVDDVAGNIGEGMNARLFDPQEVAGHSDAETLFADPNIDLISICTATDTHVDLARRALSAGKHVLLEKPIALKSADVRRIADAAARSGKICMPAMCMRFWPAWSWLKRQIDEKPFGKCRSLMLQRIGGLPAWAPEFYLDPTRSGGAIVDLHIHDADFVRFCFGEPRAVSSAGYKTGEAINHVVTHYQYDDVHVVAEGGWLSPGFVYRMRYIAEFEQATVDFDISRTPQLLLARDGKSEPVTVDGLSGYDGEVRHLIDAIANQKSGLIASIDDAVGTARLLEAEIQSVQSGMPVAIDC